MKRPLVKPIRPEFSSGPCTKRPGWSLDVLKESLLGRSHRHKDCKKKLKEVIELSKSILNIPDDYLVAIVPGSDTGAVEIAMWNLLGSKPVKMLVWDSFGADWAKDIQLQLKLKNLDIIKVDYGKLPNLNDFDFKGDIVFNWNGTTAGVCVPNADWIKSSHEGLIICDATSAAFAMDIEWSKLDVGTFSWQKSLGGEAGHGMLIFSPKAVDRINTYSPNWPIPKLFQLKKNNEINLDIFSGSTINTPSMICVEDFLDVLNWTKEIGGLEELIRRSKDNLNTIKNWVLSSNWVGFLCEYHENLSNTSICLKLIDHKLTTKSQQTKNIIEKNIITLLEENNVAFDIGSYRSAPPGLRIWGGPTVDNEDIKRLLPWLDWAYYKSLSDLDI